METHRIDFEPVESEQTQTGKKGGRRKKVKKSFSSTTQLDVGQAAPEGGAFRLHITLREKRCFKGRRRSAKQAGDRVRTGGSMRLTAKRAAGEGSRGGGKKDKTACPRE